LDRVAGSAKFSDVFVLGDMEAEKRRALGGHNGLSFQTVTMATL
jgi:hypothetical protein